MTKHLQRLRLYILLALQACAPTVADITAINRDRLNDLSLGMTKPHVMRTMGPRFVTVRRLGCFRNTRITNPHRSEAVRGKDGSLVEVLYYGTEVGSGGEFVFTEDELTPMVFKDGRLVGWGWNMLFQHVDRAQLHFRYQANPPRLDE